MQSQEHYQDPTATVARRLLPWFLWAQVLPALAWRRPEVHSLLSLAAVVVPAWLLTRGDSAFQESLLTGRPRPGWGRMTAILLLPALLWPRLIALPFHMALPEALTSDYPGPGLWLAAVVIVIVPLTEELIYRGLLLCAFSPWGRLPAILASALLFGLGHGPVQFLGTAVFGWVLGWLAWEYRSIWPGFLLHAAFNLVAGVSFVASLRYGDGDGSGLLAGAILLALLIGGLGVTVAFRRRIGSVLTLPWREDAALASLRQRLVAILRQWPVAASLVLLGVAWWGALAR